MRDIRTSGSVEGAVGNHRPYSDPSRLARRRHSGPRVGTALQVTGTESAVVRGPIPPAPAAVPARLMRATFMNNAG
jgi:hypothetical protein